MFKEVGKRLKLSAWIVFGIGSIASIVMGIVCFSIAGSIRRAFGGIDELFGEIGYGGSGPQTGGIVVLGIFIIIFGIILSYICALMVHGYGKIVENTDYLAAKNGADPNRQASFSEEVRGAFPHQEKQYAPPYQGRPSQQGHTQAPPYVNPQQDPRAYSQAPAYTPEPRSYAPTPEYRPEPKAYAPEPAYRPEPKAYAPEPEYRPEPKAYAPEPEYMPETEYIPEPQAFETEVVSAPEPEVSAPQELQKPQVKYCGHCGSPNEIDYAFCLNCGSKLD